MVITEKIRNKDKTRNTSLKKALSKNIIILQDWKKEVDPSRSRRITRRTTLKKDRQKLETEVYHKLQEHHRSAAEKIQLMYRSKKKRVIPSLLSDVHETSPDSVRIDVPTDKLPRSKVLKRVSSKLKKSK